MHGVHVDILALGKALSIASEVQAGLEVHVRIQGGLYRLHDLGSFLILAESSLVLHIGQYSAIRIDQLEVEGFACWMPRRAGSPPSFARSDHHLMLNVLSGFIQNAWQTFIDIRHIDVRACYSPTSALLPPNKPVGHRGHFRRPAPFQRPRGLPESVGAGRLLTTGCLQLADLILDLANLKLVALIQQPPHQFPITLVDGLQGIVALVLQAGKVVPIIILLVGWVLLLLGDEVVDLILSNLSLELLPLRNTGFQTLQRFDPLVGEARLQFTGPLLLRLYVVGRGILVRADGPAQAHALPLGISIQVQQTLLSLPLGLQQLLQFGVVAAKDCPGIARVDLGFGCLLLEVDSSLFGINR